MIYGGGGDDSLIGGAGDDLIDDGQIPAYKFGRVIRVQAKDVAAFVESAKVKPGSLQHLYTT